MHSSLAISRTPPHSGIHMGFGGMPLNGEVAAIGCDLDLPGLFALKFNHHSNCNIFENDRSELSPPHAVSPSAGEV